MTDTRKTMQQALELCERIRDAREVWSMEELRSVCLNLRSALAQQGEQHSIPVSAYNRLQALCDSQAETIMKLQDKLDSKSSCENSAWGADVMQRIVDSQTGFVREKP